MATSTGRAVAGGLLIGVPAVALGIWAYKIEEGHLLALPQAPVQVNPPTDPVAVVSVTLPPAADQYDVQHVDANGNPSTTPGTLVNGIPVGMVTGLTNTTFVVSTSLPKSAAPGGFIAHVRVRAARSLGILGRAVGPWSAPVAVRFAGQ